MGRALAALALALVLAAGAEGAYQRGSIIEKWDTALSVADSTANSNLIVVSATGGTSLIITAPSDASLTFEVDPSVDTTCSSLSCTAATGCIDPCGYTCRFMGGGITEVSAASLVAGSGKKQLTCPSPAWGSDKPATSLVLKLYKGDLQVDSRQSADQIVYMEEDIISSQPASGNAAGEALIVTGSGFDPAKVYHCALFSALPTGDGRWLASTGSIFPNIQGINQTMTVMNSTTGSCSVAAGFAAHSGAKLTLLRQSQAYNKLSSTTGVRQPVISYMSNNAMFFDSTAFQVRESWTSLSTYYGLRGGGDIITITGAGFSAATAYECEFSVPSGATVTAAVTVQSSTTMSCTSPAWTDVDGNTEFRVKMGASYVESNQQNTVYFFFLRQPVWNEGASVAADTVVVEGVGCARNQLEFRADNGGSELRMVMSYTPLRPRARDSFTQKGDAAPSLADVLRATERMETRLFMQGAMVDTPLPNGRPSLTVLEHTLQLPTAPQPLRETRGGVTVNIPDNSMEPAGLNLTAVTRCDGVTDSACGTLVWEVNRGWEGYAYEVCVIARHAIVPSSQTDSSAFNSRCVYVVVPKCRRCYRVSDSLHAIASSYGTSWVDLWSVNPGLSNTTAPSSSDEVGYNTPGDLVYIRVDVGQSINTGILYRHGSKDTLTGAAKRFGMTLSSLMAINPDIVMDNQDADMSGKLVCILQQSKVYDKCDSPSERPDPVFWEKILGYDDAGAAIKQWNPRYPRQPIGGIPRHGGD